MSIEELPRKLLQHLIDKAKELGDDVYEVSRGVLDDDRFIRWSGSSKHFQHHFGTGGLLYHTYDVVGMCLKAKEFYDWLDEIELYLAALFHDAGKMYDYENDETLNIKVRWHGNDHRRKIGHLSRSALIWSENARRNDRIYEAYHDKVLHAILAHHGSREAGSPVAPDSRVAWVVHLCDAMSARMNDVDTLDIVNGEKGTEENKWK